MTFKRYQKTCSILGTSKTFNKLYLQCNSNNTQLPQATPHRLRKSADVLSLPFTTLTEYL